MDNISANTEEFTTKKRISYYAVWILAIISIGVVFTISVEALARFIGFDQPEASAFGYVAESYGETSHGYTLYANNPQNNRVQQLKLRKFQQKKGYSYSVNVIDGAEIICLRITRELVSRGVKRLENDDDYLELTFVRSDGTDDVQNFSRAELQALLAMFPNKQSRSTIMLYVTRNPQPFTEKADKKRAVIALARNCTSSLIREISISTTGNYIKVYNPEQGDQFFVTSRAELEEVNAEIIQSGADVAIIEKQIYKQGSLLAEKPLSWLIGLTGLSITAATAGLLYFAIVILVALLYISCKPRR